MSNFLLDNPNIGNNGDTDTVDMLHAASQFTIYSFKKENFQFKDEGQKEWGFIISMKENKGNLSDSISCWNPLIHKEQAFDLMLNPYINFFKCTVSGNGYITIQDNKNNDIWVSPAINLHDTPAIMYYLTKAAGLIGNGVLEL